MAEWFTLAARDVYAATEDSAVAIPDGFSGGSLDFAGSPLAWCVFKLVHNLKWIGTGLLIAGTMALMWWNRMLIIRNRNAMIANDSDKIETIE